MLPGLNRFKARKGHSWGRKLPFVGALAPLLSPWPKLVLSRDARAQWGPSGTTLSVQGVQVTTQVHRQLSGFLGKAACLSRPRTPLSFHSCWLQFPWNAAQIFTHTVDICVLSPELPSPYQNVPFAKFSKICFMHSLRQ